MSLKLKSDEQLLVGLEELFQQERVHSRNIFLHLKEIWSRRLYAKRGYGDLVEMLIKHYRQSEPAARQRMKTLELMLDVPVVEERLVSGDLNLSTVAMAQRKILEQEKIVGKKLSSEKKAEIVDSITGKTLDQTEIELFKQLPEIESSPKTVVRRVSADATRFSATLPNEVRDQITRLKEIWSHIDPSMDPVEIMRRAFNIALDKVDPMRRTEKSRKSKSPASTKSIYESQPEPVTQVPADSARQRVNSSQEKSSTKSSESRRLTYYGKEIDRQLWERAESRCEFIDPVTKKRCDCRALLQHEHVIPLAKGGTNELSNLQLLCRTHNLLRARQVFGDKRIDHYQKRRE